MKRTAELIFESVLIGALLIGVALGGSISTSSLPSGWVHISNPGLASPGYDLSSLASYYNKTLTLLATDQFANATESIFSLRFLGYPSSLSSQVALSGREMISLNASLSSAEQDFNQTTLLFEEGKYPNALANASLACASVQSANETLAGFSGDTTKALLAGGVPISVYSGALNLTRSKISSLEANCVYAREEIESYVKYPNLLSISTSQSEVEVGGTLFISGILAGAQLIGKNVTFFLNGTYFGSTLISNARGDFSAKLSVPYLYKPRGFVWATVALNRSSSYLPLAVSNQLLLKILYNETRLDLLNYPQSVLPTFGYALDGRFLTSAGFGVPNATLTISAFEHSFNATTRSDGSFNFSLPIPSNATQGINYLIFTYKSKGSFSPMTNVTRINVVLEPLDVSLSAPPVLLSGWSSSMSGAVSSNGAPLSGASLEVQTPWGVYQTSTNNSGAYSFQISAPLLGAFSPTGELVVSANPTQPYVASSQASRAIEVINPLGLIVPAAVVGLAIYFAREQDIVGLILRRMHLRRNPGKAQRAQEEFEEQDNHDLFEKVGGRKQGVEEGQSGSLESSLARNVKGGWARDEVGKRLVHAYEKATKLATSRLGVQFGKNLTIRETILAVRERSAPGGAAGLFAEIADAIEDYLYSQTFDPSRVDAVEVALSNLEREEQEW